MTDHPHDVPFPIIFRSIFWTRFESLSSFEFLSLISLTSQCRCELQVAPNYTPNEHNFSHRILIQSSFFGPITYIHSNDSDYGTHSPESSHSISLLVSSHILMGWRVKERPRVCGGRPHRMLERWRRIMVDGSITQGQTGNGTLPLEFRTSTRRKLSACKPSLEFDAWKRGRKHHQTFSTEKQNLSQTIPSLCACRISKSCCSCGQHQQRLNPTITHPVQAIELFAIAV